MRYTFYIRNKPINPQHERTIRPIGTLAAAQELIKGPLIINNLSKNHKLPVMADRYLYGKNIVGQSIAFDVIKIFFRC
jgi:hypothetical protein